MQTMHAALRLKKFDSGGVRRRSSQFPTSPPPLGFPAAEVPIQVTLPQCDVGTAKVRTASEGTIHLRPMLRPSDGRVKASQTQP